MKLLKLGTYEIVVFNGDVKSSEDPIPTVEIAYVESELKPGDWDETAKVNTPKIMEGMKKVYWDASGNEIDENNSNFDESQWYKYVAGNNNTDSRDSKWANVKMTKNGVDAYFVWIPRYEYKITPISMSRAGEPDSGGTTDEKGKAGKIEVKFIPTNQTTADEGYIIHPAFQDGSPNGKNNGYENGEWKEELSGIWVGKYETSRGDATISSTGSNTNLKIVPSVQSWGWGNQTIGELYTIAYNYDRAKESHLMKNSEWGAVAYLTHSQYGRNGDSVTINNNNNYVTGIAGDSISADPLSSTTSKYNTPTGQLASSTGNIYGIYDLSGGSYEYVAAFNNTGSDLINGSSFADPNVGSTPYATMYSSTDHIPSTSTYKIGDATYEVYINSNTAWFNDKSYFVYYQAPFFLRGGDSSSRSRAGIFESSSNSGDGFSSFRLVLVGSGTL